MPLLYLFKKQNEAYGKSKMSLYRSGKIDSPRIIMISCAILTFIIIFIFMGFIFYSALPTFESQGLYFIIGTNWNYSQHMYGALYFIVGTVTLTIVTMVIACPISILTALYLAEFAPATFTKIARPLIELLVGIPSVVYGIFGLFVLQDFFKYGIYPFINNTLGFIPIFRDITHNGNGILLAATVLAVMVLPTITVLSIESIKSIPQEYREASLSIGATKWETIKKVILPMASGGIITAIILAVMRAMGETMAIVMLMGNYAHFPASILDSGFAITTKILSDAEGHLVLAEDRSALFALAATLFVIEALFVIATKFISRSKR